MAFFFCFCLDAFIQLCLKQGKIYNYLFYHILSINSFVFFSRIKIDAATNKLICLDLTFENKTHILGKIYFSKSTSC